MARSWAIGALLLTWISAADLCPYKCVTKEYCSYPPQVDVTEYRCENQKVCCANRTDLSPRIPTTQDQQDFSGVRAYKWTAQGYFPQTGLNYDTPKQDFGGGSANPSDPVNQEFTGKQYLSGGYGQGNMPQPNSYSPASNQEFSGGRGSFSQDENRNTASQQYLSGGYGQENMPQPNSYSPASNQEFSGGRGSFSQAENRNTASQQDLSGGYASRKQDLGASKAPVPKDRLDEICGLGNPRGLDERKQVGPWQSTPGQYPWVVALFNKGSYFGGGSLISPRVVLTAAHQIFMAKLTRTDDIKVRAGDWDLSSTSEAFQHEERWVTDVVYPDTYVFQNGSNNIALLFLDTPFELKPNIRTICLPQQDKSFDQRNCIVAGWGKSSYESAQYASIQKKLELSIEPRETCQDLLRRTQLGAAYELPDCSICAGGQLNKDACSGDGGFPLFCPMEGYPHRYEQAGIVSYGIECGRENVPGVYTNVAKFRDWIDEKLAGGTFVL
ncbi:phenoloxidase-activating factor 2-like [Drosophila elegans]|uniref:phenoloxidase-activating factor 2-like n=1 Tax=Drosophila elegans TaxID=30023 RepID=UPI0007E675E2|nr:phenoloxidase-activating factor 2-like [Drosophila elegans]